MSELEQGVLSAFQFADDSDISVNEIIVDGIRTSDDNLSLVSQLIPFIEDELTSVKIEVSGASRPTSQKVMVQITLNAAWPTSDVRDRAQEVYKAVKDAENEAEKSQIRAEMAELQKRLDALEAS